MSKGKRSVAVAITLVIAAVGCSSSKSTTNSRGSASGPTGSSSGGSAANTQTVTVGILADVTGPAASGNATFVEGVKAGSIYALRQGYKIKYVVGDTATSPAGALSAAQRLVAQEHVSVVLAQSALTFAAAPYLTSKGIPVIGAAQDGPEWRTAKNMFGAAGDLNTTKAATTLGQFFKMQGGTSVGSIGNGISPISAEAAKAAVASAKAAGLKIGYLNANLPLGTTDMQPIALAMKSAGVDSVTAAVQSNTAFALITSLRQQGVNLKAAALATGYGGDLLQAGPGALQSAQNVFFYLGYQPIEMQTAATKQFSADLKAAGIKGEPTYAEYNGYNSTGLLVRTLKTAGPNPSSTALISTLSNIHDWDALGLFGSHKVDINDRVNTVAGVDNCLWFTKLQGAQFKLVSGADPICGTVVPGVTIRPNS